MRGAIRKGRCSRPPGAKLLPLIVGAWLVAAAPTGLANAASAAGQLFEAVKNRNAEAVAHILRNEEIDIDAHEGDGMTPLHWSVYLDDESSATMLLEAGANPALATQYGVTPLRLATENHNDTIARLLLAHGADFAAGPSGETALHVAARVGAIRVAEALLEHGAIVDARDEWQSVTSLMIAAAESHVDLVRLLIDAGADVNAKADETELFIGPGDESTTYTQIPRGGMTALMFAAREGCLECVRLLANAGADVNYQDPAFVTPMNLAIYNGHFDTAALLLDEGADPNDGSVYLTVDFRSLVADGVNADHHPVPRTTTQVDSAEMLVRLLEKGGNPDHELLKEVQSRYLGFDRPRYLSGLTPLQRAARQADLVAMQILIDGGADPSLPNRISIGGLGPPTAGGERPLHYAVQSVTGVPANILGNRPGKLAYRARREGDSVDAVKLLLDRGADVNGADWNGDTPLHVAARLGANDLVSLLFERGADLEAKNLDGETALDAVARLAARSGRPGPPALFGPTNPNPKETVALLEQLRGIAGQ